ncbi:hypothetical protein Tco_0450061 [Tanacetum coccineum]
MLLKEQDPLFEKYKVNTKPINYAILNNDYYKRFVRQTDLYCEQAYWKATSVPALDPSHSSTNVILKVPKELLHLSKKEPLHTLSTEHTQEEALVLRDIVEHVKANYPQDPLLESAFRYTKVIQDLLSHISRSCPSINNCGPQLIEVIPRKKDKQVRFAESLTSKENTKPVSTSNIVSNKRVLHSTGVRLSTSASGSQPSGNTKNDRILQTPSSNSKNKVEAHPRNVKSSLNKRNGTVKVTGSASVQKSKKQDDSDSVCVNSNDCMSSDNVCVSNAVNVVKSRAKPKKNKPKKDIWKPTGKVFTQIGYIWRPTGRTFTIVGNACPLTRITTTNEVPSRKPIVLDSESPKPVVKLVYSRKPRKNKNTESVSKTKVLKPMLSKSSSGIWTPLADLPQKSLTVEFHAPEVISSYSEAVAPNMRFQLDHLPQLQLHPRCTITNPDNKFSGHTSKGTKDHSHLRINRLLLTDTVSTHDYQLMNKAYSVTMRCLPTSVEPKNNKESLTQACWIEAMQENPSEFERLETTILQSPRASHKPTKYALDTLKEYGLMKSCDPVISQGDEVPNWMRIKKVNAVDPSHIVGYVERIMSSTTLFRSITSSILNTQNTQGTLNSGSELLWIDALVGILAVPDLKICENRCSREQSIHAGEDSSVAHSAAYVHKSKAEIQLHFQIENKIREAGQRILPLPPRKRSPKKAKQKTAELETISEADLTKAEQLKIITKRKPHSKTVTSSHSSGSLGADEGNWCLSARGSRCQPDHNSEADISHGNQKDTDEDDSSISSSDEENSDNDVEGTNVEGAKMDEEATYEEDQGTEEVKDTNTDLDGRDKVMTDVEDTHVTQQFRLHPNGQQQSFISIMEPSFTAQINRPPTPYPLDIQTQQPPIMTPATTTSSLLQNLPNFASLFGFDNRLKALEDNFSELRQTNQYAEALSSIPSTVEQYLANKMQEAKIIKEQVKKEVSKIIPKVEKLVTDQLESEVLVRSSKEANTSHAVAANLSELELKKILIDKMEANNSINSRRKLCTLTTDASLKHRNQDFSKQSSKMNKSDRRVQHLPDWFHKTYKNLTFLLIIAMEYRRQFSNAFATLRNQLGTSNSKRQIIAVTKRGVEDLQTLVFESYQKETNLKKPDTKKDKKKQMMLIGDELPQVQRWLFKMVVEVPDFRYSDTTHLSRSVEVLKLKKFQERCNIKAFQEWYEHVGPEVASPQDGKVTRWRRDCAWLMISRCSRSLCQIQVQGTSSIQEVNDHYNIFTRESQEYELKTKDKA